MSKGNPIPTRAREVVKKRDQGRCVTPACRTVLVSSAMSERQCEAPGCEGVAKGRRYCHMHAKRWARFGSLDLPAIDYETRFWTYVDKSGECWIWTGGRQHQYGAFWAGEGRSKRAHRFAWEITNGPLADGEALDHVCRNTLCVRPSHLRIASKSENGQNLPNRRRGTQTGVRGVTWHKGQRKYHARVGLAGRMHFIGAFDSIEEAESAVRLARLGVHTHNEEDRVGE